MKEDGRQLILDAAVGSFVGVLIALFGVLNLEFFMIVIMLNLPFELTNALWFLVKGLGSSDY